MVSVLNSSEGKEQCMEQQPTRDNLGERNLYIGPYGLNIERKEWALLPGMIFDA